MYIVDRKKRSLKIAAVNVFPAEIEQCVQKLPYVSEACAVGAEVQGKQYVKVFVTLKTPTDPVAVKHQVVEVCRAHLIKYSVPRFVQILDTMPRTTYGKIDYKSLQDR